MWQPRQASATSRTSSGVADGTGVGLGATVAVSVGAIVSVGDGAVVSVAALVGSNAVVASSGASSSVLRLTSSGRESSPGEQAARMQAIKNDKTINLSFVINDTSASAMIVILAKLSEIGDKAKENKIYEKFQ